MSPFIVPIVMFITIGAIAIGLPIAKAWARRMDRNALPPGSGNDPALAARLERIEHMIEAMAMEVERISEGQRFVTKLLAEAPRPQALPAALPAAPAAVPAPAQTPKTPTPVPTAAAPHPAAPHPEDGTIRAPAIMPRDNALRDSDKSRTE